MQHPLGALSYRVVVPPAEGWQRPSEIGELCPGLAAMAVLGVKAWDLHTGPGYAMRFYVNDGADGEKVARALWEHLWACIWADGDEHYEITTEHSTTRIGLSRIPKTVVLE